ncbi:MAG: hypothetical protein IJG49_06780 [Erysipelotrichaceae bacterium]|nr:hypothetical protein [Erysipelotrichaceae bacterium]
MKKIIIILLVMLMITGCGSSRASEPSPGNNNQNTDYNVSELSFEEFEDFYAQIMYEGLPEDRTNLALGNADGLWRYDLKINRDDGMFDELGFAQMTVDNNADPRIQIVLHPRIARYGEDFFEETDDDTGYEPFGGDFDENRELKLTGNDCVLVIKRYYMWQGKEYLIATMWLSEEESGDFMMVRGQSSAVPDNNDPEPVDNDELPEYSGSSRAFTSSPLEGITVSAEAGAFNTDTTVRFTSLEELPEQFAQIEEDLLAEWVVPVCAWEVDAGLKDDEMIPGSYEVEIDLEKLGIDPDFWPAFSVARVGDDGSMYEYAVTINDNKAVFTARQNSVIMGLLLIGGVVYRGAEVIDYYRQTAYFRSRHDKLGRFIEAKTIKTDYGTYEIWWSSRDYMPDDAAKLERIHEIELKYENEAKEYGKVIKNASEMAKNKEMASYYKNLLEADEEYMKLKQGLKLPDAITETINKINIAYNYLGGVQKIRMPFTKVIFEVRADGYDDKNKDKLGEAGKQILQTVVSLWPHKAMGSQEDKDNYLLTITHELFHVCQERYRLSAPLVNKLSDDPRYDEMVTMVLERDAKKYYQTNGIITTDPNLTEKINWDTLRLPIDDEPVKEGTIAGDTVKMREGYMLGDFIMYLQQQFPKVVSNPHALMKARSFVLKATVSDALRTVFKLTEAEFDTYYRKWLISRRNDIMSRAVNCFYEGAYYPKNMIKLNGGDYHHVDLDEDSSYYLTLRGFQKEERILHLPGFLVVDDGFRKNHSSIQLLTLADDFVNTPNGIYFGNITNLIIGEIYGKLEKGENMKVGYSLWVFGVTPSVELKEEESDLAVKLPAIDRMAKAGIIDGYLLTISADGNKILETEIAKDLFETTRTFAKSELFKNTDKKQLTVAVTICEYVKDNDGNRCMGRESLPVEITIGKHEESQQGGNTQALAFNNLYLYKDATCYFDGDVIDSLLDNPEYKITSWPNGNTVIIDGQKITIILSPLNWSFTGADLQRDITEARVTYTRDEIKIYGELMNAYAENRSWFRITDIQPNSFNGMYADEGTMREGTYHGPGDITYEYVGYRLEEKAAFSDMGSEGKIDVQFNNGELSYVEIILHGTYKFDHYFKKEGDEYDVQKDSSERTFTQTIKLMR